MSFAILASLAAGVGAREWTFSTLENKGIIDKTNPLQDGASVVGLLKDIVGTSFSTAFQTGITAQKQNDGTIGSAPDLGQQNQLTQERVDRNWERIKDLCLVNLDKLGEYSIMGGAGAALAFLPIPTPLKALWTLAVATGVTFGGNSLKNGIALAFRKQVSGENIATATNSYFWGPITQEVNRNDVNGEVSTVANIRRSSLETLRAPINPGAASAAKFKVGLESFSNSLGGLPGWVRAPFDAAANIASGFTA